MSRNVAVVGVLLALAIVPVTCSFLFSGKDEDAATPVPFRSAPAPAKSAASGAEAAPSPSQDATPNVAAAPSPSQGAAPSRGVPVFKGFEDPRYQKYDAIIQKFVDDFNGQPEKWAGSTSGQATSIPPLTTAQVKAHIIQETGGGDLNSRTAWAHDPLQVNVPGDWNPYKKYLGLKEPRRRNEGSGEANLKAGLMLLARKGFGVSGQPASNRPDGDFDGWARALQRYNGRSDKAADGSKYSEAYSARIRKRAETLAEEVPIPIPTKKKN